MTEDSSCGGWLGPGWREVAERRAGTRRPSSGIRAGGFWRGAWDCPGADRPTSRMERALQARVGRRPWVGRATAGRDTRECRGWPRAGESRRGSACVRRSRDTRRRPPRIRGAADPPRGSDAFRGRPRQALMAPCPSDLPHPGRSPRQECRCSGRAASGCSSAAPPGSRGRASRRRGRARRGSGLGARGARG